MINNISKLIDDIVKKFSDEFGYIPTIDKVIDALKEEQEITDEDYKKIAVAINDHNISIYNKIKEDNEKLNQIENLKASQNSNKKYISSSKQEQIENSIQEFMPNVGYYILQINQLIDSNKINYQDIEEVLPSKNDDNWKLIIDLIYLNYKNKLVKTLKDKRNEESSEYIELYEQTIDEYQKVLAYLLKYKEEPIIEEQMEKQEIKIIFDPDTIEKDLSNIPIEKYQLILCILNKLKINVLKSPKSFRNNLVKNLISELRTNDIRIFFDKIDSNTYVIYYIFVKKVQNSTMYLAQLINRANSYFGKKDEFLKSSIENSEELTNKIMSLLDNTKSTSIFDEVIEDESQLDEDDDFGTSVWGM